MSLPNESLFQMTEIRNGITRKDWKGNESHEKKNENKEVMSQKMKRMKSYNSKREDLEEEDQWEDERNVIL